MALTEIHDSDSDPLYGGLKFESVRETGCGPIEPVLPAEAEQEESSVSRRTVMAAAFASATALWISGVLFDAEAANAAGGYVWPVGRNPLPYGCGVFGAARPIALCEDGLPGTRSHQGGDFTNRPVGTPIGAITSGTVEDVSFDPSCAGYTVLINHGDFYAWYIHMQGPSRVGIGSPVVTGQTVGLLGNTGGCTNGAHLHLEIRYGSQLIDPVPFLLNRVDNAPPPPPPPPPPRAKKGSNMSTLYYSEPPTGGVVWALAGDGRGTAAWLETREQGLASSLAGFHAINAQAVHLTWATFTSWKARYLEP